MPKHIRNWLSMIFIDLCLAALFFYGFVLGQHGPANAFLFIAWARVVLGVISGITFDKSSFQNDSPGRKNYEDYRGVITAAAVAWFGMFWLASGLVIAQSLRMAAREREPKQKQKGTQ